jgi:hypothetical protein
MRLTRFCFEKNDSENVQMEVVVMVQTESGLQIPVNVLPDLVLYLIDCTQLYLLLEVYQKDTRSWCMLIWQTGTERRTRSACCLYRVPEREGMGFVYGYCGR